ncbi:MAG: molybdopterin-dependent oxidoreductase [Chloroflexi bacterium]|nr:molybdopterin-dependent oxidoreductase [Chloroflexota bacterium]
MQSEEIRYERLRQERKDYQVFNRGGSKDYWAYTHCGGCYAICGAKVRVVDGWPVAIESIPESDLGGKGGMCGKGVATVMDYHDPNRVNYPVKRTNPKKGIGEDPGWQRISWEEALDTIAKKLIEIRKTDPRQLVWGFTPGPGTAFKATLMVGGFFVTFGTLNRAAGGVGAACGAVAHHIGALVHGAWDILPDYQYCNYVLRCGGNEGTSSGRMFSTAVRLGAAARDRGMKTVVMDPVGYLAGSKATEWIPILPGTDLAVFLAMANLIVNEIGIYDKEYLRAKTNGPYLAGPDRLFVRDPLSGKPLLWDETDSKAKTYDDQTLTHPALEGEYTVNGVKCHPAFHLLKEHLKQYDPAWAAKISTVPEKTIRRLAKELVEEARIGSTIEINGKKIPFRPACVVGYKGVNTHTNGFHQYGAMTLINSLLGNQDVCGGILGSGTVRGFGHPETGRPSFQPYASEDGMLTPGVWFSKAPWPPPEVSGPGLLNFTDIFPNAGRNPYPYCDDWDDIWNKVGRPYEPQALALYGANTLMSAGNPRAAEAFLKKVPFVFSINTVHNETTEGFADIVLPECHFLENLDIASSQGFFFNYPIGMQKWSFHFGMPVTEPKYERRTTLDMLFDLADRVGIREGYNSFLENWFSTKVMKWEQRESKPKQFDIIRPEDRIKNFEFTDRTLKFYFGKERGLDWFVKNGFITWDKKPEECYWRYYVDARIPVYHEVNLRDKEAVRKRAEKIGMDMEWDQYTPLLSYFPAAMYTDVPPDSEFDLVAVSPRDVLHTHRFSAENPWVDELSQTNPYTYNIVMHADTAKEKGIKEGDVISLENFRGDKVTGRVKLSQLVHRQAVAVVGLGGWAKGRPIALGKGINFNELLPADHKHIDPICGAFEINVMVKAYKVDGRK